MFDNNFGDGSGDLARKTGATVRAVFRRGKGFVISEMFRDIDADVYLMVDADDQLDPNDTAALVIPVMNGCADMVIGDRLSGTYFTTNRMRFHNMGNRLGRFLVNSIFKSKIRDIMTGAHV